MGGDTRVLDAEQVRQFITQGYTVVRGALPAQLVAEVADLTWHELRTAYGVDRDDPSTWLAWGVGGPGYFRTTGQSRTIDLATEAPRAWAAIAEALGGEDRVYPSRPDGPNPAAGGLAWSARVIANLGPVGEWTPPCPQQPGWHKDGWHFRHFLDSPEQGLLVVPFYSDVRRRAGGTVVATDSVGPVARLLADHPEGVHPDSMQGSYLIPGLIEQCSQFDELVGEAGDLALVHPFVLHRAVPNPTSDVRFIANAVIALRQPMQFDRADGNYSLVERAILAALATDRVAYTPTAEREFVTPAPMRDEPTQHREQERLDKEKRAFARAGILSPPWATQVGYDSNRDQPSSTG